MDFQSFLNDIKNSPDYADQIVYVRETQAREPVFADPSEPLSSEVQKMLSARGIDRLYTHQAKAVDLAREGKDILIVTGTASGKSLCYTIPILEALQEDPDAKILLLFPTKALCQDQYQRFRDALVAWEKAFTTEDAESAEEMLEQEGMGSVKPSTINHQPSPIIRENPRKSAVSKNKRILAGVFDGDTPADMRRKLRDHASVIFTNPDMVHSGIMPQHARWSSFLSKLKILVLDELHVYNGIFGSNMANFLTRFFRLCRHYQPGDGGQGTGDRKTSPPAPPLRIREGETADSESKVSSTDSKCSPPCSGEGLGERSNTSIDDDDSSDISSVDSQSVKIRANPRLNSPSPDPRPLSPVPQILACSATIAKPDELAKGLTGRDFAVVDNDGSPKGKRTYVFWNPPRVRETTYRSRKSANVEAHELMAMLVQRGVPTITFSKAKMTAEMIHRYVCEKLRDTAPHLMKKVSPYRGGYLPEERREIERQLFSGELMGVSTTPALELGIDVGGLDASIMVGYPGTLASFYQQAGRAGRQDRDALVVLVGLDTSVNQYIMSTPDYIFDRPIEEAVIDPQNPFVVTGHLRCAAQEKPLEEGETGLFGPNAPIVLKVLEENLKVKHIGDKWYHSAPETPQHEITLRDHCDQTVVIAESNTGKIIGEVHKYDAPPLLHREAIYMHQGDTYRVLSLDLERNIATVKREEVDYYTQAVGGTDVNHIDHSLREKDFGTGKAYWGEVTSYFGTGGYEKIHFYTLDAISYHPVDDVPSFTMDTMAFWIIPPEDLMRKVREAGLDAYNGLRGIGYATRMVLPLFMTCQTLDFSHTVGSVNSPWNTIFIYERYPLGLAFTEKAYERLHEIMPAVLENIKKCGCDDGCPCCVGKPLRQFTVWNVERGEASIPSKKAAIAILEGLLADGSNLDCPDIHSFVDSTEDDKIKLEMALRRRLEKMGEPQVFHPIKPRVATEYPEIEKEQELQKADVERRSEKRRDFNRELRKRIKEKLDEDKFSPNTSRPCPPQNMRVKGSVLPPTAFPGKPEEKEEKPQTNTDEHGSGKDETIKSGDSLAARARRLKKERKE